jgi:ankyrin repeat protein
MYCDYGNADCVKILLDAKVDANANCYNAGNPITMSACNNKIDILKMLIKHKCDPNFKSDIDSRSSIFSAALYGRTDAVKILIESNANLNDDNSVSPICGAAKYERVECLQTLIDAKCDVNKKAANRNDIGVMNYVRGLSCITILIQNNVDIFDVDNFDCIELYGGDEYDHDHHHSTYETVKTLLALDLNCKKSNDNGLIHDRYEKNKLTYHLLKNGIDPQDRMDVRLHIGNACEKTHNDLMNELILYKPETKSHILPFPIPGGNIALYEIIAEYTHISSVLYMEARAEKNSKLSEV